MNVHSVSGEKKNTTHPYLIDTVQHFEQTNDSGKKNSSVD